MKRNLMIVLGLLLAAVGAWKLYSFDTGHFGDADVAYALLSGFALVIGVGMLLQAIKNPGPGNIHLRDNRKLGFVIGVFALFWLIVAAIVAN